MMELSLDEVNRLVDAANTARWQEGGSASAEAVDAERRLEARFGTSRTLAVYGTLAPGEPNHHVVAPLGGDWTDGVIEGNLVPVGWGATLGYPAFRPRIGGADVAVKVLRAPALPAAWPELDRFEGPGYRRILVPVLTSDAKGERRLHAVANLYAAAEALPGDAG
ncbi:gamma-glutamylcyclotransferase family protein [Longimicrobium sp.]|uniref:gamma-glutamylcyclotransferase family protein n=1 Tax=Longimicrobium sp. TaxID=2029185 RepID=UPI002E3732DA|nr:gamma-glutamylcyclotransferase [Longimicrobium sp.]HEX6041360.1 gamma-glutamylcyclotransferase [Longimicrobium sp.]